MKNLKSPKLYFQVYDALREYIIKNNLKPGDKMPTEAEMTEALGVSRNVLREGIKTLEIIGVLSSKPGVGMIINSFNSNFLSSCIYLNLIADNIDLALDAQQVRKVLELGFAKQSFAKITDSKIARLEELVAQMSHLDDAQAPYEIDKEFHGILLSDVPNQVLKAFADSAWACDKYFRQGEVYDDQLRVKKHAMIVEALKNRSYEDYYAALKYHFTFQYKTPKDKQEV